MAPETPPPTSEHRGLRRLGGGLLTLVVALGGVVLLLLFFQSRDESQLDRPPSPGAPAAGPGERFAGPGLPAAIPAGGPGSLSDAEVLGAIERGNVVMLYGTPAQAAELRGLARRVAGPPDAALEAVGQSIVLDRRPGLDGVVALAWRRVLRAPGTRDPRLEAFAAHWLGRGAP